MACSTGASAEVRAKRARRKRTLPRPCGRQTRTRRAPALNRHLKSRFRRSWTALRGAKHPRLRRVKPRVRRAMAPRRPCKRRLCGAPDVSRTRNTVFPSAMSATKLHELTPTLRKYSASALLWGSEYSRALRRQCRPRTCAPARLPPRPKARPTRWLQPPATPQPPRAAAPCRRPVGPSHLRRTCSPPPASSSARLKLAARSAQQAHGGVELRDLAGRLLPLALPPRQRCTASTQARAWQPRRRQRCAALWRVRAAKARRGRRAGQAGQRAPEGV